MDSPEQDSSTWSQLAGGDQRIVDIFNEIAINSYTNNYKSEDHDRLSSAFCIFEQNSPYNYTSDTLLETIAFLATSEGYENYKSNKRRHNESISVNYSTVTPDKLYGVAFEFIQSVLHNIRDVVCTGKQKPSTDGSLDTIPPLISGVATALVSSAGISSPIATGLAAAVLVVVARPTHKSFCDMTDEEVVAAVEEKTGRQRRTGKRLPSYAFLNRRRKR